MHKKFVHFKIPEKIEKTILDYKTKAPQYWEKQGIKKAIELTNFTIENVPAYRSFLKSQGCNIKKVTSIEEFEKLPLTDKSEYLKKSVYKDLFPSDGIDLITTIASTSGSTGEPFYFPRGEEQDEQNEHVFEVFLRNQFEIDKKRTLVLNGFGLGIWIGGILVYKNINKIASKGHGLTIAPVGRDKNVFLKTFKKMASLFDQIILMGYPPFIKDIVDEAKDFGINFKNYDLKIMTATEGFSENFRDYLVESTGIKSRYLHTLNIYGSVEFGTMSHETPISILIRDIARKNSKVFNHIFSDARVMPTLVQYYPHVVNFEEVNGEIIATGYGSSLPLIRYRFFDKGGVYKFDEMLIKLKDLGIDIIKEAKKVGINESIFKLPFMYVHERSDFVVNLRGANIYPGSIKTALENRKLSDYITGKFTMIIKENKKLDEYLEIIIEMKKNKKPNRTLKKMIIDTIVSLLLSQNSEFANMYGSEKKKAIPKISLLPNEDSKYFSNEQIKQKWAII